MIDAAGGLPAFRASRARPLSLGGPITLAGSIPGLRLERVTVALSRTAARACFTVARHFKKELRYLTKNLGTLIEPLLTLGLAVVVLFVALPVFLADELGWSFYGIGGFLAAWVIGYGIVQSVTPRWLGAGGSTPFDEINAARTWALVLGVISATIALAVAFDVGTTVAIVGGLVVFGVVFALNS